MAITEPPSTDAALPPLLAAAREGHTPALREIYESLSPAVLGYARGHGVEDPDALANETLYRVLRDLSRFDGSAARFRSWVFTVAHNLIVDDHRRRSRRPDTVELARAGDQAGPIDRQSPDAVPDALMADELVGWIGDLVADQRAVVLLRFVADLSIKETAEVLGKRPGAVKSLQHRGLAALRRRIDAEGVSRSARTTFTEVS